MTSLSIQVAYTGIIKLHRNGNLMMMNWISCHEFEFRPGDSDLYLAEPQARASRDLSRPGGPGESDGRDRQLAAAFQVSHGGSTVPSRS